MDGSFRCPSEFSLSLLFNFVVAVPTNESQSLGICSGVSFSPSILKVSIEMHPQHPPALIPYGQIGCRTPCTHCNCAPVCATVPWIQITNAEIFSRGRVRGENSKPAPSTPDPTGQDRTKRREEKMDLEMRVLCFRGPVRLGTVGLQCASMIDGGREAQPF